MLCHFGLHLKILCSKKYYCYYYFLTDSGFGTIYASDDRGAVYSKSLERHLYTATGGETDFTNVTSLRGVFITSVLAEGISIQWVAAHACSQILP